MEKKVYVDVLLVINYIVNILLIQCTAKLTGQAPKRRRIVAAAFFGSVSALTIFLPYGGRMIELLVRLGLAGIIVRIAFPFYSIRTVAKQIFVFFAVSFFFSGVMLALWMSVAPNGMVYYNGIVYFDISSLALIVATAIAYLLLSLLNRFARAGRIHTAVYTAEITYAGKTASVRALVDTGNSLYEPFSDIPVMVCRLDKISDLLPKGLAKEMETKGYLHTNFDAYSFPVRLIPYRNVSGDSMIPAFRPDSLTITKERKAYSIERVYIGISSQKIGGHAFGAILNPDMIGIKI